MLQINLDYRFDTNNFFNGHPDRQAALRHAADVVASRIRDTLTAINPTGPDHWTPTFVHPSANATTVTVPDLVVPPNTIIIFAGAENMTGTGKNGEGYVRGAWSATSSWADFEGRGKPGASLSSATAFSTWGGTVTFDLATSWYFGLAKPSASSTNPDFVTRAEHEIAHVLGFGTAGAWFSHVAAGFFTGTAAKTEFGGPVPLDPGNIHWAHGTLDRGVPVCMDPVSSGGRRDEFARLDYAGLADIGWQI
jgi:hypothetical protein